MTEPWNPAALRAFFRIAEAWQVDPAEQAVLLGTEALDLELWRIDPAAAELPQEALARLGYLLNIYAALQVLLPVQERADAWVRQPNKAAIFGGGTALAHMLGGRLDDLIDVALYLASMRNGDFA